MRGVLSLDGLPKGQGHTYRAIGERMGVTGETAGQIAAGKHRASSE
ncbi:MULTISPECIES: hypothetical protein [unclassified Streptomyces]